jgi:hypothetical protein
MHHAGELGSAVFPSLDLSKLVLHTSISSVPRDKFVVRRLNWLQELQHDSVKMDILRRQTMDKDKERIEKYILDTALANDYEVTGGNIDRLFAGVRQLFLHILLLLKHFSAEFTTRIQYNSLDRSYSRLMLWYDVYQSICSSLQGEVPSDFTEAATRYLKGIALTLVDRESLVHLLFCIYSYVEYHPLR